MDPSAQRRPLCPEYARFPAVCYELEFASPLRFARQGQRPFRQTSGDRTIVRIRKQKDPLAGSGIVSVPVVLSGQPLLAQLFVCFAEDLQIPVEYGVGLRDPKVSRRIKNVNKERE